MTLKEWISADLKWLICIGACRRQMRAVGLSAASPRTPGLRAGVAVGFPLLSLTRNTAAYS